MDATLRARLINIWQNIFDRTDVQLDSNFFDLGGTQRHAIELFAEISRQMGRELPAFVICQAPTIEALASLLEHPRPASQPILALMKPSTADMNIFITHGIGGSILDVYPVVRRIDLPLSIFGMQGTNFGGVDSPPNRIEQMADFFLSEVTRIQPRGPYFLIGYSLGGLVVLEMAQRLVAAGNRIGMLALVDAYPARRFLAMSERYRLYKRLAAHHFGTAHRLSIPNRVFYLLRRGVAPVASTQNSNMKVNLLAYQNAYAALNAYRPRFYPGKIHFIRAQTSLHFPDDPLAVWGKLAEDFEIETVHGNHETMLSVYFEELASVLSRYLLKAASPGMAQ